VAGAGTRRARPAARLDDFVILCTSAGLAAETLGRARATLAELGLSLNPEKTRLVDFDRGFRFLGRQRNPVGGPTDLLLNFAASLVTRDIETLVLRHGLRASPS
jgi:hypothetical protein